MRRSYLKYLYAVVILALFSTSCVGGTYAPKYDLKPWFVDEEAEITQQDLQSTLSNDYDIADALETAITQQDMPDSYLYDTEYEFFDEEISFSHTAGVALIAHAGGALYGYTGTNSIEAIKNANSLRFRYIELDMITTSDGQIVLKHSWHTAGRLFSGAGDSVMGYDEFMGRSIHRRFTPTNLPMLIDFLRENPEPRIITDTKATDYAALYEIAANFPELMYRFIPQVYRFGDAYRIRNLGFDDIILTTYMFGRVDPALVRDYAISNNLYAVGIPDQLATEDFLSELDLNLVRIFVHTIDDLERAKHLKSLGVQMLMTGFLTYTYDLSCIMRPYSLLLLNLESAVANIKNLDGHKKSLIGEVMFYRLKSPVYFRFGEVLPVSGCVGMAEIFIHQTGEAFFAIRNFQKMMDSLVFDNASHTIRLSVSVDTYVLTGDDFYLYRNLAFVSESLIESLFGLNILRSGDYFAIIPFDSHMDEEELFFVARKLFEDI